MDIKLRESMQETIARPAWFLPFIIPLLKAMCLLLTPSQKRAKAKTNLGEW